MPIVTKLSLSKKCKQSILNLLNHWFIVIFMTVLTFYALFCDDIRIIFFSKEVDNFFYAISCLVLLAFFTEILLYSIASPDYFLAFFFWLDVVAALSIIPDIGWIMDNLAGSSTDQAASLAKTSRAARVTRVIRIIRIIRLIRIVKLYKQARIASRKRIEREQKEMEKKL